MTTPSMHHPVPKYARPPQEAVAAAVRTAFDGGRTHVRGRPRIAPETWRSFCAVVASFPRTLKPTCGQVLQELDAMTASGVLEYDAGRWRRAP